MKGNKKSSRRYATYLLLALTIIGSQFFMGCGWLYSGYGVRSIIKDSALPSDRIPDLGPDGKPKKDVAGNVILIEKSMYCEVKKGLVQIDPDSQAFKHYYWTAKDTSNPAIATNARDHLISRMKLLSEKIYHAHKADILGRQATFNIASGSLTSLFSGAATFVGGATTKSGLAAGAALSNATNSLVNKEVYYKSLAITIIKAIDIDRKAIREAFEIKQKEDVTEYSVDQAISDLQEYHFAGTFLNGLKIVYESVENRKPTTEELQTKIHILENQIEKGDTKITALRSIDSDKAKDKARLEKYIDGNSELETKLNELRKQLADSW